MIQKPRIYHTIPGRLPDLLSLFDTTINTILQPTAFLSVK